MSWAPSMTACQSNAILFSCWRADKVETARRYQNSKTEETYRRVCVCVCVYVCVHRQKTNHVYFLQQEDQIEDSSSKKKRKGEVNSP
jgi:hypothetical protein